MPVQVVAGHSAEVVISKSKSTRYGTSAVFAVAAAVGLLICVLAPLWDSKSDVNAPTMRVVMLIAGVIGLALSFSEAGPCELSLDPHTRRYRLLRGLPLFARPLQGSYDDIAEIVIRSYTELGSRGSGLNVLEVKWAVPGRKNTLLRAMNVRQSYEMRDEIQQKAGLSVHWKA